MTKNSEDLPADWTCLTCGLYRDEPIVECDTCGKWFHQRCEEYKNEQSNAKWNCSLCQGKQIANVRRSNTKQVGIKQSSEEEDKDAATCEERGEYPNKNGVISSSEMIPNNLSGGNPCLNVTTNCRRTGSRITEVSAGKSELHCRLMQAQEEYQAKIEHIRTKYVIMLDNCGSSCKSSCGSGSSKSNKVKLVHDINSKSRQHAIRKQVIDIKPEQDNRFDTWLTQSQVKGKENEVAEIARATADQIWARQSIPRKLPVFSGDPKDWPAFYNAYQTSTRELHLSNEQNFIRLRECLKGEAWDMVEDDLLCSGAVPGVIKTLKQLFGRADIIINAARARIKQIPPPELNDMRALIRYAAAVRGLVSHVNSAGSLDHTNNRDLFIEVLSRLPSSIQLDWQRHKRRNNEEANVSALSDFLTYLAEDASELMVVQGVKPNVIRRGNVNDETKVKNQKTATVSRVFTTETVDYEKGKSITNQEYPQKDSRRKCYACDDESHILAQCKRFIERPLSKRWDLVVEKKLCRCCLRKHFSRDCKNKRKCGEDDCEKVHHRLLHKRKEVVPKVEQDVSRTVMQVQLGAHSDVKSTVLFRVVPVTLYYGQNSVDTCAFLDDGSSVTLLDEQLANELQVNGPQEDLCLKWTGDTIKTEEGSKVVNLEITSRDSNKKYQLNDVRTMKNLNLPVQSIFPEELKRKYTPLRSLPIKGYKGESPKILIGLNHWRLATTLDVREGDVDDPVATKTRLGWVVCGPYTAVKQVGEVYQVRKCECNKDEVLHQLIKKQFSLEEGKMNREPISKADERAVQIMEKTSQKIGERYVIGLLWKYNAIKLPGNYTMALSRLRCLEKKMVMDLRFGELIKQQIQHYKEKSYISKVEDNGIDQTCWYLPMFAVENPNKPGKFRVVWDAAAKVNGVSLNHILLKGPDVVKPLLYVLFKFCEGKVAVTGDITEMFHQVLIRKEDRPYQRFLWRDNDQNRKPDVYQMNVMTFGAACSPSSAQFIKNKNAKIYEKEYPRAVQAIVDQHYVDDYLDSFETEEAAIEVATRVRWIHSQAGFEMKRWMSNSENVVKALGETQSREDKNLNIEEQFVDQKVLGLWWDPRADVFRYRVNTFKFDSEIFNGTKRPTKRELLRFVMSIYDPKGYIGLLVIHFKIIIQEVWRANTGWDEQIRTEEFTKWEKCIGLLKELRNIQVQRCYSPLLLSPAVKSVQLHIFCDASDLAYAVVAYFRIVTEETIHISLVYAKTKVSPIKPVSIPRMELQACLTGSRMAKTIESVHYWTDSATVLRWLNSDARNYRQYVSYRIGEIQENTEIKDWRWVPSELNAADYGTKWHGERAMENDSLWFKGPEYLKRVESDWPKPTFHFTEANVEKLLLHSDIVGGKYPENNLEEVIHLERYSTFRKAVRVLARVLRIAKLWLQKIRFGHNENWRSLSNEAINIGEYEIIRMAQWKAYKIEIITLQQGGSVGPKSKIYSLSPYWDKENRLLRVKGRINQLPEVYGFFRKPIILPQDGKLTELVVDHYHNRYLHQNHETVVNEIRQKYMIPRLREVLKTIRKRCQACKIERAKPNAPEMGELPSARLSTFTRPFTYVGVDMFGPLLVKVGRRQEKRYGMLFTCLTVRAIHLEVAHSMTTDSFIMVFRNFMARRGAPVEVWCDNGTNFRGTKNELDRSILDIKEEKVREQYMKIRWRFNPPGAPHMGGAWECLIRAVKVNLLKVLPSRTPTDELLLGCLIEVEHMVNSRPLTYMPIEARESEALTPNHFLLGSSSGVKPIGEHIEEVMMLRKNWKIMQLVSHHFWKRWVREVAPLLTRRTKWFGLVKNLEVGDIVIIIDENSPRGTWPKGIIEETIPGADGQVRRRRPATKLAVLDVKPGLQDVGELDRAKAPVGIMLGRNDEDAPIMPTCLVGS